MYFFALRHLFFRVGKHSAKSVPSASRLCCAIADSVSLNYFKVLRILARSITSVLRKSIQEREAILQTVFKNQSEEVEKYNITRRSRDCFTNGPRENIAF